MRSDEFVARVRERADLETNDEARRATEATLTVLGDRLAGGEPSDLAAQLPAEFGHLVAPRDGPADPFALEGFYQRIAEREGCSVEDARRHARAVMETLSAAIPEGELDDVRSQLPNEYLVLLG